VKVVGLVDEPARVFAQVGFIQQDGIPKSTHFTRTIVTVARVS
jgi:hypothetical protein